MSRKYKHIFFDLDHTLWDFEKNARETLLELYDAYNIDKVHKGVALDFVAAYDRINSALWKDYEEKKITKDVLRTERFKLAFMDIGVPQKYLPENIWEDYLQRCPKKTNLMPHAKEVCASLSTEYDLHIVTNGFEQTQHTKVDFSGLRSYFLNITTSECVGLPKPNPEISHLALEKAQAKPEECVMIGDNLQNDVLGALNMGIDAVWYNPEQLVAPKELTEIRSLKEVLDLFMDSQK